MSRRVIPILALLAAGVGLCVAARPTQADFLAVLIPLVVAAGVAHFGRDLAPRLDALRAPPPRAVRLAALGVFLVSLGYFIGYATWHGWVLAPRYHDEHSYLVQVRLLATGRLWLPAHELADHFETFHVLTRPAYASIYFPGTALAYLPTAWLGLPVWVMPMLLTAGAVAVFFLVMTRITDAVGGIVGAVLLLALPEVRTAAVTFMAQPPTLLFGFAATWAYLRWHDTHRLRFAALLGAAGGWLLITRPIDGLCFLLPIFAGTLLDLRRVTPRTWLMHAGTAVACAAPFAALQLVFNVGVTGSWRVTPYDLYCRRDQPQMTYGFARPELADARSASGLVQKRRFYDEWVRPALRRHTPGEALPLWVEQKIHRTVNVALPTPLLVLFVPLAALGLRGGRPRAWVVPAVLVTFVVLYTPYPNLLRQYVLLAAGAAVAAVVIGVRVLAGEGRRARPGVAAVAFLAATGLLGMGGMLNDDPDRRWPELREIDHLLATEVKAPAIVLFRYAVTDKANYHVEPVYNIDAANPDDAKVIRAHDLGPERNGELFKYYATRQPQRNVYLYDRGTERLTPLGNVRDLAAR